VHCRREAACAVVPPAFEQAESGGAQWPDEHWYHGFASQELDRWLRCPALSDGPRHRRAFSTRRGSRGIGPSERNQRIEFLARKP